MYNVLSIDIDYAYSPTISLYDDHIEGSRISLQDQQKILAELNLPEPEVNQEKLDLIQKVVSQKVARGTPVHIIQHHHDILKLLPLDTHMRIYNFDHHHDVFYPGWHDLNVLDEGNWVSYLSSHDVEDFYWIRNKDSEDRNDYVVLDFAWHEIYLPIVKDLPKFDLVIGCISPHWTDSNGKEHLDYVLRSMK